MSYTLKYRPYPSCGEFHTSKVPRVNISCSGSNIGGSNPADRLGLGSFSKRVIEAAIAGGIHGPAVRLHAHFCTGRNSSSAKRSG